MENNKKKHSNTTMYELGIIKQKTKNKNAQAKPFLIELKFIFHEKRVVTEYSLCMIKYYLKFRKSRETAQLRFTK